MPRKTHPSVRSKHSRAHIRYQRHAWANKRFNRAKRIYADDYSTRLGDDAVRNGRGIIYYGTQSTLDEFNHPNEMRENPEKFWSWWATRSTSEWSKNWQTYCSCLGCSKHRYDPIPRAVTEAQWREDWQDEINDCKKS